MNDPTDPQDDSELFRRMMADVTPLPDDNRLVPEAPRPKPKPRQVTAEASDHDSPFHISPFIEHQHIPATAPEEHLFFARDGLQQRVLKKLKRGEYAVEDQLDLHGYTIIDAGVALSEFLQHAQQAGLQCVLVVHGKGQRSADTKPVLKSQVNYWLRQTPEVLAFCSAQPRQGGTGAAYILLRRSSNTIK